MAVAELEVPKASAAALEFGKFPQQGRAVEDLQIGMVAVRHDRQGMLALVGEHQVAPLDRQRERRRRRHHRIAQQTAHLLLFRAEVVKPGFDQGAGTNDGAHHKVAARLRAAVSRKYCIGPRCRTAGRV